MDFRRCFVLFDSFIEEDFDVCDAGTIVEVLKPVREKRGWGGGRRGVVEGCL